MWRAPGLFERELVARGCAQGASDRSQGRIRRRVCQLEGVKPQ